MNSNKPNKHGLYRTIPSAVKRQVRKNSGFGCVICGAGYWEYEHIEPEFHQAKAHNAEGITLLCMQCHGKKTKGIIDKETVLQAMKKPKALEIGHSTESFVRSTLKPIIRIGSNVFVNVQFPIIIDKIPLIRIFPPEIKDTPFLLSGEFLDSFGKKSLILDKNEWKAYNDNWDVNTVGSSIEIREKLGAINLKLTTIPPNTLYIEKLEMTRNRVFLSVGNDGITIKSQTVDNFFFGNNYIENAEVGIDLSFLKKLPVDKFYTLNDFNINEFVRSKLHEIYFRLN